MTTPTGSLRVADISLVLSRSDRVHAITPVHVAMLLSIRNTWGGTTHRYDGDRGFFKDDFWAKQQSEKLRVRGTSFRVDETPALQLNCAKQSFVLVSFNSREPFADWNYEIPARRQSSWRAGIRLGRAIGMVGEIEHAGQAEARGLVVLMPPTTGSLAVLGEEPPRSWWSEPRPGRQQWSTRVEPEFSSAGALAAARLFVAQTGDERRPAPSAAQPPHMKLVPRSSGS